MGAIAKTKSKKKKGKGRGGWCCRQKKKRTVALQTEEETENKGTCSVDQGYYVGEQLFAAGRKLRFLSLGHG